MRDRRCADRGALLIAGRAMAQAPQPTTAGPGYRVAVPRQRRLRRRLHDHRRR